MKQNPKVSRIKIQKITSQDAVKAQHNKPTQSSVDSHGSLSIKKRKNTLGKIKDFLNPNESIISNVSDKHTAQVFNKFIPSIPRPISNLYTNHSISESMPNLKLNSFFNREESANSIQETQVRKFSGAVSHKGHGYHISEITDLSESFIRQCLVSPGRYVNSANVNSILEELKNNNFTEIKKKLLASFDKEQYEEIKKRRAIHHKSYNSSVKYIDDASSVFIKEAMGDVKSHVTQTKESQVRNQFSQMSIPEYKLKEGQPKSIDFFEQNSCYIWIETYGKYFPMHITSNLPGVNFEYYMNFANVADQINFDHYKQILDPALIGKSGFMTTQEEQQAALNEPQVPDTSEPAKQHTDQLKMDFNTRLVLKKVEFENFVLPNTYYYHFKDIGDIIHVNKTKKIQSIDQDVHFIVLYIKSPKPCRVNFSISFTSPKFIILKNNKCKNLFGETHKKFLFEKQEDEESITKRKHSVKLKKMKDIIGKNKSISVVYQDFKDYKTTSNKELHKERQKLNLEKYKKNRQDYNKYFEDYLLKHDILKQNMYRQKIEDLRQMQLFMNLYTMKFSLRLYQVLDFIKSKFWKKKEQNFNIRKRNNRAKKIQCSYKDFYSKIFFINQNQNGQQKQS